MRVYLFGHVIKSCREKSEIWCKSITKNVKSFLKTTQTNHGKVMIMIIPHLWSKVKVGAECLMNCRIIKKLSRSLDARIIFWSNIWYGSPFGTPDSSKQWSSRNGQWAMSEVSFAEFYNFSSIQAKWTKFYMMFQVLETIEVEKQTNVSI